MKEYEQSRKQWLKELELVADSAWEKILAFLQFPDGVWRDVEGQNIIEKLTSGSQKPSSDSSFVKALASRSGDKDDGRMSVTSSVFSEAKQNKAFELAIKRSEAREEELPPILGVARPQQFVSLRRIYINQYLILLGTIIRESHASHKALYERCLEVINLAESQEFDDLITKDQMKTLILKLHECLSN